MASRAPPSSHRRRKTQSIAPWMPESGSEPYQESRRALSLAAEGVGMASGAETAQADDQGPAPPRILLRLQALEEGRRVDAVLGQEVDDLGPQAGIVAVDEHGPDQLRSRELEQRRGEPALDLGQPEVALRRRLDHRQDHREGPVPILARGQAAKDLPELVRVGVGQQSGQRLGPVGPVRLRGEFQQQRERQGPRLVAPERSE